MKKNMESILVKVKRQDHPEDLPYWELFEVGAEEGMTVISVLEVIRENPLTSDGAATAPVLWESSCCEGACGACTMRINGKVRLACSTLLSELSSPVVLEPLQKFPVVRDLKVDRGRMFEALGKACVGVGSIPIPGGPSLSIISPELGTSLEPFAGCVMCGACSVACPQVDSKSQYIGAFLFCRALPMFIHPGASLEPILRMDAIIGKGGLADCSGASACDSSCPKGIPLTEAIAKLNAMATRHALGRLFR